MATAPQIGDVIAGKFLLREVAGRGGMATVYRAEQTVLGRSVAVKILDPELAADPAVAAMFLSEARAASRINHPNIVSIIDFGQTPEGAHYLIMEYLKGRTLTAILQDEFPLPPARLASLLAQVLDALEEAHSVEVVHRDLKPDNILVERLRTGADLVKVCDFGIARLLDAADEQRNVISGTPEYMSPEQVRGLDVDFRTDLYSAGIVLYEMLTGQPPFLAEERVAVLMSHCNTAPEPPRKRRPDLVIAPLLEAITLRALTKDPAARFQSAVEFREALLGGNFADTPVSGPRPVITPAAALPAEKRGTQDTVAVVARTAQPGRGATRLMTQQIPLVGREHEVELIERLVKLGHARSLVLSGPPGSGKTRLCETAVKAAEQLGYRAVRVGPDPRVAVEPWWPIRRAIARLLDVPTNAQDEALKRALSITRGLDNRDLMPGLSELFQSGGVAPDLEFAVRRRECTAAALRALRGCNLVEPTVLVFEDVDRYDQPSRNVIERLVDSPGDAGLLVIATGSTGAAAESESGIDEWTASESIPLSPLPVSAVRSLVATVLPDVDPSRLAESAQSPLQIREYLRQAEEGASFESASVGDLILTRLRALPLTERLLIQTIAVLGHEAPRELCESLLGAEAVQHALDPLVASGFLHRAVAETLVLSHALLRALVYEDIPAQARRELHGRVFRRLDGTSVSAQAIAHHAHAAGVEDARVIALCERAGLDCQQRFDDHAAVEHYRNAWEVARWAALRGDDGADEQLARLACRLGDSMLWAGQVAAGESILREGESYAGGSAEWHARIQRALARAAYARGDIDSARQRIQRASGAAIRAGDPGLLAETYLELGNMLDHAKETPQAITELEEGIALCTGGQDDGHGPRNLWRIRAKLAELKLKAGDPAGAASAGDAALRAARTAGSLVGEARSLELLGEIRDAAGAADAAAEYRRAAVEVMRRLGDRRSTAKLLVRSASDTLPPRQAQALLREARELAIAIEWDEGARRIGPPTSSIT